MKTLLGKLKSALAAVVKVFSSGEGQKAFDQVAALVVKALPIVELVAAATPTRSDDVIIALFKKYGLPWLGTYLGMPQDQRGAALLRAASTLLGRVVPGTPTHILDAAVQLALVGSRAAAAPPAVA